MLTRLKRICFIGLLVVLSGASNDALSNEQTSLFEQFDLEQTWTKKHRLATDILANPDLPNLQRVTIYSDLAELAFTQSDLANALKYFKSLEANSTLKEQPKLYFRAIKMQGVVLYYQGLVQQAVVDYNRALNIAITLKSPIKQANLLSNIGLAYFDMYNMELALDYYQQPHRHHQALEKLLKPHGTFQELIHIEIDEYKYRQYYVIYRLYLARSPLFHK